MKRLKLSILCLFVFLQLVDSQCICDLTGTYSIITSSKISELLPWSDDCEKTWEGQIRVVETDGEILFYTQKADQVEPLDMSMGFYNACYGSNTQDVMPNGSLKLTRTDG